jgi:hypothetical protein
MPQSAIKLGWTWTVWLRSALTIIGMTPSRNTDASAIAEYSRANCSPDVACSIWNTWHVVNFSHLDGLVLRVYDWSPLDQFPELIEGAALNGG